MVAADFQERMFLVLAETLDEGINYRAHGAVLFE